MAKPKKKCPPARTKEMKIRFTEDHFDLLTREAKAARLPRAEYIRQLTLDNRPVIHQELVFNDPQILKIFSDLGHCGGNLNQLAKHLNQGGEINQQVRDQIIECISELYEMRDSLSRLAGEYRGSH